MKLELFDRAAELKSLLPAKYADIILNSIIARSAQDGGFFKEASLFLTKEEAKQLAEDMEIEIVSFSQKIKSVKPKPFIQSKKEEKEEDYLAGFTY